MKAAVLKGIDELSFRQVETPDCGPGEVLVKLGACGICRTDLKCLSHGQRDLKLPRILGHEISGIVVERGSGVTQVAEGERVQVAPGIPCGICKYCLRGQDNLCSSINILGFHKDGGFAEYVLIPEEGVRNGLLQRIPEYLSFAEAALTEPLACCVNMQDSLGISKEDQLLIIGAGPLGILNAKLAKARGVKRIILVEEKQKRLKRALNYEFDYVIDSNKLNVPKEISNLTKGMGIDAVIPCCPGIKPFTQGINLLSKRGRLGFFSGLMGNDSLGADLNLIHYKELFVSGAYGCSSGHNREALSLMSKDKIMVRDMITKRISLAEVLAGLEMVRNQTEISVIIEY
ncbi:MAG: zinc-dependent dehydrogenase [Desulfitobacteriaceae bacterium]|nr:zinc-dependent dehydrogenase [Desulfitobacteriaceae bacterium]MDD4346488.1 zinc-dependent dehydrogenase [Desulfitobacteriaceae bacterium]MDD4401853.1 zinc-dependent dehydrogenase [Desulfitobacteriaceae bacterium]